MTTFYAGRVETGPFFFVPGDDGMLLLSLAGHPTQPDVQSEHTLPRKPNVLSLAALLSTLARQAWRTRAHHMHGQGVAHALWSTSRPLGSMATVKKHNSSMSLLVHVAPPITPRAGCRRCCRPRPAPLRPVPAPPCAFTHARPGHVLRLGGQQTRVTTRPRQPRHLAQAD